ncbi:MAG: penicillin-binding protein activator [Deltaproteobacteria bacterium]|nr:penicillin-binding protein activator [Deltaproteobacteria bacterium]
MNSIASILCLSVTVLPACVGPKLVILNGVEMTYDDAAKRLYEQGETALSNGDPTTARARFMEVVNRFADAPSAADALFALGAVLEREEGCRASGAYLGRFLNQHPSHPKVSEAKTIVARCEASGQPLNVPDTVHEENFQDANTDSDRLDIAQKAATDATDARNYAGTVRWLLQARTVEQDSAARDALEAKITDLIDRKLSFVEIRQLLEEQGNNVAFPSEVLTYKLGRVQYHARDLASAKETLARFIQSWPASTYADGARGLLARIDARQEVEPLKVGVFLPLSGVHETFGKHALEAIRLGLGKKSKIDLVVRDTKSDPSRIAETVSGLVLEEHVIAILGGIFSYEAAPAAYKAQELGVPFLTISKTDVTTAGPYVFRNALSDEAEMRALVSHAMDVLGMKSFAILYPRHNYGEELYNLFWDEVEKRNGEIRGIEVYEKDDTTFSWPVKRLVARDRLEGRADYRRALDECNRQPDAYRKARCREQVQKDVKPLIDFDGLFIPDYPRTVAMISAALAFEDIIVEKDPKRLRVIRRTLGYNVQPVTLLGTSGWNSEKLVDTSGRTVENAIFPDAFFSGAEDRPAVQFLRAFEKKYGRTPLTYPEALMYDSIRLIKAAIEASQPTSRDALREALRTIHDHPGASGNISFTQGNDAQRAPRILTVKDGRIVEIPRVEKDKRKTRLDAPN